MLVESVPCMGSYEFESALAVGPNSDTGAYFTKSGCGFIDLDVDVLILEEAKC